MNETDFTDSNVIEQDNASEQDNAVEAKPAKAKQPKVLVNTKRTERVAAVSQATVVRHLDVQSIDGKDYFAYEVRMPHFGVVVVPTEASPAAVAENLNVLLIEDAILRLHELRAAVEASAVNEG